MRTITIPDEGEPVARIRMDAACSGKGLVWTFSAQNPEGRALLDALGARLYLTPDEAKKLATRLRGLGIDLTDKIIDRIAP